HLLFLDILSRPVLLVLFFFSSRRRHTRYVCSSDLAAAGANPIVAMPPLVMNDCGLVATSCCPAPFLFHPTSVTNTVSFGAIREISLRSRAGWIGLSALRCSTESSCRHASCCVLRSAARPGDGWIPAVLTADASSARVAFASPTRPTATG